MSDQPYGTTARPHVVVLGAGFAGVECARGLADADADVTLVDRHAYNTFQPLLYQVATASLNPGDITYFLRALNSAQANLRVRHGEVLGIDPVAQRVELSVGEPLAYDYLVIATGVTANYFGVPGAEEHAFALYTRNEALRLRDRIWSRLEQAAAAGGRDLNVVVVGGGATGVEMAGTLGELREHMVAKAYPELDAARARIVLVEMGEHLLSPFAPRLQRYTEEALRKRGVELRLGTVVKEVREDSVVVDDGEVIPAGVTVWASGIKAPDVVSTWGLPQGEGGRIEVDRDLRVRGFDNVFAAGDIAVTPDPLPQVAQPALQGGKHVARQLVHLLTGQPTKSFSYLDKGTMATIGRSAAVAQLPFKISFTGFIAWAMWLGVHVVFLLGYRNRISTLANLAVRYLAWRRSINAIVGEVEVPHRGQDVLPIESAHDASAVAAAGTTAVAAPEGDPVR
jgi:NADH dehydrogenase